MEVVCCAADGNGNTHPKSITADPTQQQQQQHVWWSVSVCRHSHCLGMASRRDDDCFVFSYSDQWITSSSLSSLDSTRLLQAAKVRVGRNEERKVNQRGQRMVSCLSPARCKQAHLSSLYQLD